MISPRQWPAIWRRLAIAAAVVATAVLIVFLGLVGKDAYLQSQMEEWLARTASAEVHFDIPTGASLRDIADKAAIAGTPLSVREFAMLAYYLNIDSKLQAGNYRFVAGVSAADILHAVATGKVAPAERITIIEGQTYGDLRVLLRDDSRLRHVADLMSEDELRVALDIGDSPFEGMFLPETYFFNWGDSDLDILRRARRSMQKALAELWPQRDNDLPFAAPVDALILASIVEKETGSAPERPLIASVFVNRLKRGMPLQADPTVIYGLGNSFDGNLTRAHLRDKKKSLQHLCAARFNANPHCIAGAGGHCGGFAASPNGVLLFCGFW